MRVYPQVVLFAVLFILGGAGTFIFLGNTQPGGTEFIQLALLYGLIFLTAFAFFAVFGYILRRLLWLRGERFVHIRNSRRQALWLGLIVVLSLFLKSQGLLTAWTALSILLAFSLLELYVNTR